MGAFNSASGPQERDVTVNFPAPGMYPYEMDYFECCGDGLAFTVGIAGAAGMPPTGNLALSPYTLSAKPVGQFQTLNVAARDASAPPRAGLSITLNIPGATARQLTNTADSTGLATFSYQSDNAGTDQIQASAQVSGLPEISNVATITWNPAPPAPTISAPSPADGSIVTKPVAISAAFAPPTGQTIASWQVTYQALDPGPVVQLASGTRTPPATLALCLTAFRSWAPHFVTIVYPDQQTEIFDFSAAGGSNIFFGGSPVYTARAGTGTTSTLSAVGADTSISFQDDGNLYNGNNQVYDPQQFKLTTLDGTVLIVDRTRGLVSMSDRNGNFITVSSAGITARSGQGIVFTRDGSARITQITDPLGHSLNYGYSTANDLASFTDADGNQTTFAYVTNHTLLKANGPAGQPLHVQQYDSAGRLIAVTDPNGNTAQITNNVPGQPQTA